MKIRKVFILVRPQRVKVGNYLKFYEDCKVYHLVLQPLSSVDSDNKLKIINKIFLCQINSSIYLSLTKNFPPRKKKQILLTFL